MPLVSYVDIVYCCNYDLRVSPLNNMNRNDFRPCFLCRKVIPRFRYTLRPCYKSDKKRVSFMPKSYSPFSVHPPSML